MLSVYNIEVYYGPIRALGGVSLEVAEGQIVALLGANGAGKTTVLKTVCGLLDDQPEKGEIEFMGKRLNGLNPEEIARLGITYVQEGRAIFEELTVGENLAMGGYVRRDLRAMQRDRAKVLDYFPILGERQDQLAGTLSGGEQQMLAIGMALMARPKLVLMDEPSLGLAPIVVNEIFQIIKAINRDGTTILLVEQKTRIALQFATYGYLLEGGRIALADESRNLLVNETVRRLYLGNSTDESSSGLRRHKQKKRWR